jgi:plastocyanin
MRTLRCQEKKGVAMHKSMTAGLLSLGGLLFIATSRGAEFGDLSARFVYDGPPPKPPAANITSDKEFCSKYHIVDESLIVNEKDRGVANVLVQLFLGRGEAKPPIHESYSATSSGEVQFDNSQCRFAPHILVLRTSQTLVTGNSDAIGHNTNFPTLSNPQVNVLIPAGGQMKLKFTIEERFPVKVSCNIHPWMSAYVVVKDHPYVGVSDANGKLEIKNLPAGEWTFQAWHEKAGYLKEVYRDTKRTAWNRGQFKLAIKPGSNDMGEIKIPASLFLGP